LEEYNEFYDFLSQKTTPTMRGFSQRDAFGANLVRALTAEKNDAR